MLEQQLEKLACQFYRRIIVQPHLLFHGELVESMDRQVADAAQKYADVDWLVVPPLADALNCVTLATEMIEKVVLDRCRDAGIHVVGPELGD